MGEIPDWFGLIQAAQELNVPPWDLAERPMIWQQWALSTRRVRNHIEDERAKAREREVKRKSK